MQRADNESLRARPEASESVTRFLEVMTYCVLALIFFVILANILRG